MTLRKAYEIIIKDLLLQKEFGTEKVITPELADQLVAHFMKSDFNLLAMEEAITDVIADFIDEDTEEFNLF